MNHLGTTGGSTAAMEWLDRHGNALYRYAVVRLRSSHAAEDVVQETQLAAVKQQASGRAGFAGQSTERTWLIGILRHKIVDRIARDAKESPMDDPSASFEDYFDRKGKWRLKPAAWHGLGGDDPHALLERAEFRGALVKCLEAIPRKLSRVFVLRVADGIDSAEIQKLTGISQTSLWTSLYRARLQLRHCLGAKGFGEVPKTIPTAKPPLSSTRPSTIERKNR